MTKIRAAVLVAFLSLAPHFAVHARSQVDIGGYVFRAPDSLSLVAGAEVRLVAFSDTGVSLSGTAKTDPLGRFRFPAPPVDSALHYRVEAFYNGVWQPAEPFPGSAVSSVRLAVFDTTSLPNRVSVEKLHLIANPLDTGIAVTAIYIIRNDGPIFVGTAGPKSQHGRVALEFFLPAGAEDVQIFEGAAVGHPVETVRGFGSLVPFYPGTDTVVFGFTVPWDGKRVRFAVESPYPVSSFSAITVQGTAQLFVEGGERVSPEEAPDLVAFGKREIPPNTPLMIEMRAPGVGRFPLPWAIVIGIGVALFGVAGVIALRRRAKSTTSPPLAGEPARRSSAAPGNKADELADEIARLDAAYQNGSVPEADYALRRRELKERLMQALREEKGGE